jgi:hypothetical protein
MSEVLRVAPQSKLHEFPEAIDLELCVRDRDVIAALLEHPDGAEREDYANEALKIGVLALRRAATSFDGEFIQRETTRLLDALQERLNGHAELAKTRLENSLKTYFDPESGHFSQRVSDLTSEKGGLARLLTDALDGDKSRLAQTMVTIVGSGSPLMKYLSPEQTDGLLSLLRGNVELQLSGHQKRILEEFSLDNPSGALCQMIDRLTVKHGSLSKDLQDKIDAVVKEFTLDEENSALSRLVKKVEGAQQTITDEFSLDNEQSALQKLKRELTTILSAHVKSNADFQEEVKIALAKLVTRREAEARSTTHGGTFETAVFEFVNHEARKRGDIAEDKSNTPGLIKYCKLGDAVIHLGCENVAAGAKIVVEAKEDAGYTLKRAQEEIEQARKNRDAQQGVFVFSRRIAPAMDALCRHGSDVFVMWDAEDPSTDAYLYAALEISRALCVRSHATADRLQVDFSKIDNAILVIEKRAQNLDDVRKSAETIKNSSEKILERVRIDRKALDEQLGVLREAMSGVKVALGGADESTALVPSALDS